MGSEKSKIDKYRLGDRVIEFYRDGKTTGEIAELITAGLQASGIDDGVDQSTVSRWLKKIRDEDAAQQAEYEKQTQEVIRARIQDGVAGDIDQIEWFQEFLYQIARNTLLDTESKPIHFNIKERKAAGMDLVKVIDTKLRLPGVGGEDDDGESDVPSGSNVFSILDRHRKSVAG